MPGLSGIELLRRVKDEFTTTEVIIASGVDRSQRALDAVRIGAFDYLIKPFDADVLRLTVERAIEHRELLLNAARYKEQLEMQNAELRRGREQVAALQAQVIQQEKMASLGQLAAGVAHELNNPVGFVHSNLEILGNYVTEFASQVSQHSSKVEGKHDDTTGLVGEITSIIGDCLEGAGRIRDIVTSLRSFSRLDESEVKETDIHDGIEATIRMLSQYYSSGKIELTRNYSEIPRINAFSGQLNQVWMNLLTNAAQAIDSSKGRVSIATEHDEDHVFVRISDTGAGIPVQCVNKIFDPFFTTKPVGQGTGLGLSISFGIVERHGGTIAVDSKLGSGSTFTVALPRYAKSDHAPMEKSIAPASAFPKGDLSYEAQSIDGR